MSRIYAELQNSISTSLKAKRQIENNSIFFCALFSIILWSICSIIYLDLFNYFWVMYNHFSYLKSFMSYVQSFYQLCLVILFNHSLSYAQSFYELCSMIYWVMFNHFLSYDHWFYKLCSEKGMSYVRTFYKLCLSYF